MKSRQTNGLEVAAAKDFPTPPRIGSKPTCGCRHRRGSRVDAAVPIRSQQHILMFKCTVKPWVREFMQRAELVDGKGMDDRDRGARRAWRGAAGPLAN